MSEHIEKHGLIPVTKKLPQEGVWVWGYIKSVHAGDNIPPVDVVRIKFGISKLEREQLKNNGDERAKRFTPSDEWGNNKVPYSWGTSGNMKYFGQEIVAWRPIE